MLRILLEDGVVPLLQDLEAEGKTHKQVGNGEGEHENVLSAVPEAGVEEDGKDQETVGEDGKAGVGDAGHGLDEEVSCVGN